MSYGYNGKVLRVDLGKRQVTIEERDEAYNRKYIGGRGYIAQTLLTETQKGIDPLGPQNKLIFALGTITGAPLPGSGRNSAGAKNPLTGGYGEAEAGGFFGPELKHAGFDAVIIEGQADKPVYLWVHDGEAEIRDASPLWGLPTKESQDALRAELGDKSIRTAQIGPAGERLVRNACIVNDLKHCYGRAGLGAVMGSKKLKAIAVRGKGGPELANPEKVRELARWVADNYQKLSYSMYDLGTSGGLMGLNAGGGLPTRNFQQGVFEGAEKISGETMKATILIGRENCYACPIRCKRVVKVEEPYSVDPAYGGPEYETLASLGSVCGIDDLKAVAKGNEICNAMGLDTIGVGAVISFAMECYERGLLSRSEADGLDLRFGNPSAMLALLEKIVKREGIGDLLAEGAMRAAQKIGRGAEAYAMQVKGQEFPMHEPRFKQAMGLGYAVSPTGAEHCLNIHDTMFEKEGRPLQLARAWGLNETLPLADLGPAKVRMLVYFQNWRNFLNCPGMCIFIPFSYTQFTELMGALTGWETSLFELMKVGERTNAMTRAYNLREGFGRQDDTLPDRCFEPFSSGPLAGVAVKREAFDQALSTFYGMQGWSAEGVPTEAKLHELGIGWVADALREVDVNPA